MKSIQDKLYIQAQEAKYQGMTKLASAIENILKDKEVFEKTEYSQAQLDSDIHHDLWKVASKLLVFYDIKNPNVEKLDKSIITWAASIVNDLEKTLQVSGIKGSKEPKVPGEE
jgi:hypothetical protein